MVLRLDPELPIVWRDPHTVQFGVDPAQTIITGLDIGQQRLIALLATGVSPTGYAMFAKRYGVSPANATQLSDRLRPHLFTAPATPAQHRVAVLGDAPLAPRLAQLLGEAGVVVTPFEDPELVVLVADRVLAPTEHRRWLQHDIPHLPVVVTENAILVGPLVEPGTSACLHCIELHRCDADPAWPVIAMQLSTLPSPTLQPLHLASALIHAAQMITRRLNDGPTADAVELRVTGDGAVSSRTLAPHPECFCSTPPENGWAPAVGREDLPPPSAERASTSPG